MSVGLGQNCVDGIEVELWGWCYNIEETTELDLSWGGLTGEIPEQIGSLTNLKKGSGYWVIVNDNFIFHWADE